MLWGVLNMMQASLTTCCKLALLSTKYAIKLIYGLGNPSVSKQYLAPPSFISNTAPVSEIKKVKLWNVDTRA